MQILLIVIFLLAYAAIALEHQIKINKTASALLAAGLLWTIYAVLTGDHSLVTENLSVSLSATSQVIFFLLGAMTIVEVVDAHNGFEVITSQIRTSRLTTLLWLIGCVTFFLSATLDNLTTTIIMVSLVRKLLDRQEDRLFFAGIIVIAANAGGAWSPIGDVTTTMLWINGQISTLAIMKGVLLPSLANLAVPLCITGYMLKNKTVIPAQKVERRHGVETTNTERNLMFFSGIGCLVAVPIFKEVTDLPPFMGIMFGLGFLWLIGELLHRKKDEEEKQHLTLVHALTHIDMSSILFFFGILLAVATLEHSLILNSLESWLETTIGRQDMIVGIIGLVSSIVDNVPLVAAAIGMYDLAHFPADSFLWEFLAYCAGTGGSILIIGSAAGVAAMGMEKIHFFWYVRKISGLALVGYVAGAVVYMLQFQLIHS
jgi:Na+/H+ antiporter NhaD/arsenite permease-like protein